MHDVPQYYCNLDVSEGLGSEPARKATQLQRLFLAVILHDAGITKQFAASRGWYSFLYERSQ